MRKNLCEDIRHENHHQAVVSLRDLDRRVKAPGRWESGDSWDGIHKLKNEKGELLYVAIAQMGAFANFQALFAGIFRGEQPNDLEATYVKASPEVIAALQPSKAAA